MRELIVAAVEASQKGEKGVYLALFRKMVEQAQAEADLEAGVRLFDELLPADEGKKLALEATMNDRDEAVKTIHAAACRIVS